MRVPIGNDNTYEGAETFTLTATAGGFSASGIATLLDDGSGSVPTGTTADDDRSIAIVAVATPVNEASNYGFFTVSGTALQTVFLELLDSNDSGSGETATIGTAPPMFVSFNSGVTWDAYVAAAGVV